MSTITQTTRIVGTGTRKFVITHPTKDGDICVVGGPNGGPMRGAWAFMKAKQMRRQGYDAKVKEVGRVR